MRNFIIDYEQLEYLLNEFKNSNLIYEVENLGKTKYSLPIRHFITGNGNVDIVITGGTHGCEIISTDFVIKLMQNIDNNPNYWKRVLNNFRIHFIPVLNPEGYLVSTSAIRKLIPREMSQSDAIKICNDYYKLYKEDNLEKNKDSKFKRHQEMFKGIDYNCIPDKYKSIKDSVKNIFIKYPDLPKWCLHTWSSNGSGIDIQANCIYNPEINNIFDNKIINMNKNCYNNIDISHPGPINCPFDKDVGFKLENETIAISNLLQKLHDENKLFAYFNYHSSGSVIYQRPASKYNNLNIEDEEVFKNSITNYMLAKLYSDKTSSKENNKYKIDICESNLTSTNDLFRLLYPNNLLIELSTMAGNPIAPYGNLKEDNDNTIMKNIESIKYTLDVASLAQMVSEASYQVISKLNGKDNYEDIVSLQDIIYKSFINKVEQLENIRKDNKQEFEK